MTRFSLFLFVSVLKQEWHTDPNQSFNKFKPKLNHVFRIDLDLRKIVKVSFLDCPGVLRKPAQLLSHQDTRIRLNWIQATARLLYR